MNEGGDPSVEPTRGYWWNSAQWMLGILGAIAVFLGCFVMFGGEDESIGFGGDLSWEVGEISDPWMYGLLAAGGVMLLGALAMVIAGRRRVPIVASPLTELLFHAGIFTVVNVFIWIQDVGIDDGVDYAYWVTIPWGIGLLVHVGTYLAGRRTGLEAVAEEESAPANKQLEHH